jgi:hypothetical protein
MTAIPAATGKRIDRSGYPVGRLMLASEQLVGHGGHIDTEGATAAT